MDPSRVGGPVNPLLSDGGLSTMIGVSAKGGDKGLAHNLQRLQARTESGGDRNLIMAFKEIGKICSAMQLPENVKFQANEYYRDAMEKSKTVKKKPKPAVYAAVIFLACRQQGYPRTFKEICRILPQADKNDIGKIYKAIVKDLELKEKGEFKSEVDSIHPENFVRRFMSTLGMKNVDMNAAVALANAALPQNGAHLGRRPWDGKSPLTIAATIIYILSSLPAATLKPSLDEISSTCGVRKPTITQLYKDMRPFLPELFQTAGTAASVEDIAKLP